MGACNTRANLSLVENEGNKAEERHGHSTESANLRLCKTDKGDFSDTWYSEGELLLNSSENLAILKMPATPMSMEKLIFSHTLHGDVNYSN